MDPQATLRYVLYLMEGGLDLNPARRDAVVGALRDLAGWVEKGGFLPEVRSVKGTYTQWDVPTKRSEKT